MTTRRHNNLPWAVANDELSYLYAPFSLHLSNLAYVIVVNGDHPSFCLSSLCQLKNVLCTV
jgi:hypothetical protein